MVAPERLASRATGNAILDALPEAALERLAPHARLRTLHGAEVVYAAGSRDRLCYFPRRGAVVEYLLSYNGHSVATSVVGREGVVGLPLSLGASMLPLTWATIMPAEVWVVNARSLDGEALPVLGRLAAARLVELNQSAACHQLHSVEQRVARWLGEIAERAGALDLELKHESLAAVIGVTRPRITAALSALEAARAIHRGRGRILIRDGARLLASACDCYVIVRDAYTDLGLTRAAIEG